MHRSGELGQPQVDVKFPQAEASPSTQLLIMPFLENQMTQQPCIEFQHAELGSAAWAQAVKCAVQAGYTSTTGSLGSEDADARTSEDSSFEAESPNSREPLRSPTAELFSEPVPVKHTFVHFDDDHPKLKKSDSAPDIMCKVPFQRIRNPEMEELHFRGECRPCAYFFHKADGCRQGSECTFCHLCPPEAVKAKRKERAKAAKAELLAQKTELNKQLPPSVYWRHRKYAAKLAKSKSSLGEN